MAKPEYISGIKWYPTNGGKGPVGKGDITFADAFYVQFVIWENDSKLRVDFPNELNPNFDSSQPVGKDNKKYFNKAGPVNGDTAAELIGFILAEFEKNRGGTPSTPSGGNTRSSARNHDAIPF